MMVVVVVVVGVEVVRSWTSEMKTRRADREQSRNKKNRQMQLSFPQNPPTRKIKK